MIQLDFLSKEFLFSLDVDTKLYLIENDISLDVFVYDENEIVRKCVAERGYGLHILMYDESWYVRLAVAKQGYMPSIMKYDKNERVCDAARKHLMKEEF